MIEIERKFLVSDTNWGPVQRRIQLEQGYLFNDTDRNLRIRRSGERYTLTMKAKIDNKSRHEFETEIDKAQGQVMLTQLCIGTVLRKVRHHIDFAGKLWEVDVFEGDNAGLIVAEIELDSVGETFERPGWLGPEVTDDPRFSNAVLAHRPFSKWRVTYTDLLAEKNNG